MKGEKKGRMSKLGKIVLVIFGILIIIILIPVGLFAYDPPLGYKWGMNREEAESATEEFTGEYDYYFFKFYKEIAGYDMEVELGFTEVEFEFTEKERKLAIVTLDICKENDLCYDIYKELKEILKLKYGNPKWRFIKVPIGSELQKSRYITEEEANTDELFIKYDGYIGISWEDEKTEIGLIIINNPSTNGDLDISSISIIYMNIDLCKQYRKENELRELRRGEEKRKILEEERQNLKEERLRKAEDL